MFGAILGDIIGSPFEFDRGDKSKEFELFSAESKFTDDTVMTIAVADGLMRAGIDADDDTIRENIVDAMHYWGTKYPNAGYGCRFSTWLVNNSREPYNSFGNGSAMRVSAAGWLGQTMEETRRLARLSAEVTHNHPEGIKGAEATACAIFMGRQNYSKDDIKQYIVNEFGYDLNRTCDDIRPEYYHVESCQETVPEAIIAFLEGEDFEDVIRTAVSLGGDCDTLTAIAGSIAEAYYGIPFLTKHECYQRLDDDLCKVLGEFELRCHFDEGVAYKYKPLYWFTKNEDGYVQIDRPCKEQLVMKETSERFSTSQQALDGWRRARLYMDLFNVWDATMFGAWMDATLAYGPFKDENGEEYVFTFTTPQTADVTVYPFLSKEQVAEARECVELFYNQPIEQQIFSPLILHSVIIKVSKSGKFEPLCTFGVRDEIKFAEHKLFDFGEFINDKSGFWDTYIGNI